MLLICRMMQQQSQENSVCACSHSQLNLADFRPPLSHQLSCAETMPTLKDGKIVASEPGMSASSAQADKAEASSAQADSAEKSLCFSLRIPSDAEYNKDYKSSVEARMASGLPRPMPDIVVDTSEILYVVKGPTEEYPVVKLPESNLEALTAPPGMSYNDSYQWQLAQLLEGKTSCMEKLPTWEPGSVHFEI